jgi:hypothetical protein
MGARNVFRSSGPLSTIWRNEFRAPKNLRCARSGGRIVIHPPSLKWPLSLRGTPLSLTLSPLLRRGERESTAGLVVVSRCASPGCSGIPSLSACRNAFNIASFGQPADVENLVQLLRFHHAHRQHHFADGFGVWTFSPVSRSETTMVSRGLKPTDRDQIEDPTSRSDG